MLVSVCCGRPFEELQEEKEEKKKRKKVEKLRF